MKNWIQLLGTLVVIAITYFAVRIAGVHALFGIMWIFFMVVSVMSIIDKEERFFGFMWLLFCFAILTIYLLEEAWNVSLG